MSTGLNFNCAVITGGAGGIGRALAEYFIANNKKVLLASLDIYRPAAQEQLKILGERTGVDTLAIIEGQKPEEIAKRAMSEAKLGHYDVLILDTPSGFFSYNDEARSSGNWLETWVP